MRQPPPASTPDDPRSRAGRPGIRQEDAALSRHQPRAEDINQGAPPPAEDLVELTIDGRRVLAARGQTIFQAARAAGIAIPHLCYHPKLSIIGSCRLCVVEVEGARNLPASCSTPVAEGMVVHTESERVIQARKVILHLLLANHPLDCLTCEKTGDCRLQAYAYQYGIKVPKYHGLRRDYPRDDTNPFFERDHTKCILCGRCVYHCAENVGVNVYDFGYRGFEAKIVAGLDRPLENSPCIFCGNCIDVCPTGALQPKLIKGKGRVFDVDRVPTVCPYCGVGCALTLLVNRGEIVGAVPANGPANRNLLCVKGRFGWDFVHHPDRLRQPLIRNGEGWRAASWEEALDLVARRLSEIRDRYGPDAIGIISSAKATNEENYLLQKLARAVIGTNNVDNSARLCHASTITGLAEAFGSGAATNPIAELEEAEVILVVGSNTFEAHPVVYFWLQRTHRRGAKVIVIDPRRTAVAEIADLHLALVPGTDIALINGMMHVILKEGLHDPEFIAARTTGFEELLPVLERYPPKRAGALTGVPAEKIVAAARLYGSSRRATVLYAMGVTQHVSGTATVRALANLVMLTGNVGRPSTGIYPLRGQNNVQGACDMGALPNYLPGYQRVDNREARQRFAAAWGRPVPERIGLTVVEMFQAAMEGRIKALYVVGENPLVSNPDLNRMEEALRRVEFLVVQDLFLTETARLAQVVLPAASFAEKDGTFTNTERRVQRVRRAIDPVGESRPDWEIVADLARRLGYPMDYASPAEIMEEIARLTPIYGGITYERLKEEGLQWPCPDRSHPGTRFLHHGRFAGGRGRFAAVEFVPPAEWPDNHYPYLLLTGRHLYHYHTNTMSRRSYGLARFRPDPYAEVHPQTAERLAVNQGDLIAVSSPRGSIRCRAFITDRVKPKEVFVPFHYPEAAANRLTHAGLDPEARIPELKGGGAALAREEPARAVEAGEAPRAARAPGGRVAASGRRTGTVRAQAQVEPERSGDLGETR
ncbi:MAG: formate dehydrogenase subunit alpha [Clostridia bacterium]|jgi:formate dehydrogenase alpha subunit|nr:formate dehydrogenase subunit alpha [Clostridia bacterium]MDH7573982.1 formate dehydrogenase subunit alpha [Clostridia bacterium]